ncbi:MAG: Gfo/Idh/MocA family oxidoreductase [Planctomycetaceae bacterium]|nr:Gfo/Idh/MocA family oxidoreductase [Planctomycetaceae bacterium]
MPTPSRRTFLQSSVVAASALAGSAAFAASSAPVGVAVIGTGGQGKHHVSGWLSLRDVQLKYVCDVDRNHLAEAAKLAPDAKAVNDLRQVLEDDSVHAVSIATPDHWHTPAALLALAAGKHVYVEKPCSHNVREGRMLVEAAAKTGKLVQHGTQSRSSSWIQTAMQLLHDGAIGDVLVAKAWDVQTRANIGKAKPSSPPSELDYEAWLGPVAFVPFQTNRHHYTWHWWHDFGTGDAGNDGVHELDIARWGLGVNRHPARVTSVGGKYFHDDDQQFPDTMTTIFEYPGDGAVGHQKQLIFELRLWSRCQPLGFENGNEFLGTKGRLALTKRGTLQVFDERDRPKELKLPAVSGVSVPVHQQNFIDAILGRAKLNADATTAHLSASLPHFANLSVRLGRSLSIDAANEQILNDLEANGMLGRKYREHWGTPG